MTLKPKILLVTLVQSVSVMTVDFSFVRIFIFELVDGWQLLTLVRIRWFSSFYSTFLDLVSTAASLPTLDEYT